MTKIAITGAASIGTPVLPPASAEWSVSEDGKSSVASILGGTAVISRKGKKTDESSALFGSWVLPHPEGSEDEGNRYSLNTQLGDCASVAIAQKAFELRIREHLSKATSDLHSELTAAETAAVAQGSDDPF